MTSVEILKRLYRDYTKRYIKKIFISVFFTVLLAGSTSSIAYLLDPAIKLLFIEQKQSLILIIPGLIVLAFAVKGSSLYIAKVIMINVAENVRRDMQVDMFSSLIKADTKLIDNKHSGKFITNLTNDVSLITNLVSTAILNLFKDSLTLIENQIETFRLQNPNLDVVDKEFGTYFQKQKLDNSLSEQSINIKYYHLYIAKESKK